MADRKDVQLIIRARTEGEKAVEALAQAMHDLFEAGSGGDANSNIAKLGQTILGLDKTLAGAKSRTDQVSEAYDRLGNSAAQTISELVAKQAEIEGIKNGLASLKAQADGAFVGPQRAGLPGIIKGVEKDLKSAETQANRLTSTLANQQTQLAQFPSALQKLASTERGLGEAVSFGHAQIQQQTAALVEQQAAATKLSAIQQQINSATGINRGDSTGTAQAAAGVLAEVAARDELIQKFHQEAAAARSLNEIEHLLIRPQGAAVAGGASFSALDQRAQQAAAFNAALNASNQLTTQNSNAQEAAAQRLLERTRPLEVIQTKLNADLREAATLYAQGAISARQLADAEVFLKSEALAAGEALQRTGRGSRGKIGLFGLKPYELTNLSFQINDVVTGLASGQRPLQIIAQQGGQILQLFPKAGAAILGALGNPVVLGAATMMGLFVVAINKAIDSSQRLRVLDAALERIGNNAGISAVELNKIVTSLDAIGLSGSDALKVVTDFVGELDPSRIQQFGVAARDASEVLGIKAPDAAKALREGLTGGFDAVVKMSDALGNVLRPAELEHIRLEFAAGDASKARADAANLVTKRLHDMRVEMDGPWAKAARGSEALWTTFTTSLGKAADELGKQTGIVALLGAVADAMERTADAQGRIKSTTPGGSTSGGAPTGDPRAKNSDAATAEAIQLERLKVATLDRVQLENELQTATVAANRIAIAGEIAYQNEIDQTADKKKAAIARAKAEAEERNRLELQDLANFAKRQAQIESTGRNNARPTFKDGTLQSTALGQGQFLESTWLQLFRKNFPEQAKNMSRDAILELRRDQQTTFELIQLYAKQNAEVLKAAGIAVTQANLSLAHHFGAGGAVKLLQANPNALVSDILPEAVNPSKRLGGRSPNPDLVGKTVGSVITQANTRFPADSEKSDALAAIEQAEAKRLDLQGQLNEKLDQENSARSFAADQAKKLLGLSADELFAEEKKQAVIKAIQQAAQEAADKNLTIDADRLKQIRETTEALFDQQHAKEAAEKSVQENSGERQALLDRIELLRSLGDTKGVVDLQEAIKGVDDRLLKSIDRVIAWWKQFGGDTPEARAAIENLQNLRDTVGQTSDDLKRATIESNVGHLQAQHDNLTQGRDFLQGEGMTKAADELTNKLHEVDEALLKAIDDSITFWSTSDRPEAKEMLEHFENLRQELIANQQQFRVTAGDIQQAFAGDLSNAFEDFAQRIADGGNAFKSLGAAALGFAASFLRDVGEMILKMAALKLATKIGFGGISKGINGLLNASAAAPLAAAGGAVAAGGGAVLAGAGALAASSALLMASAQMLLAANAAGGAGGGLGGLGGLANIAHDGGTVGSLSRSRSVWPGVFAAAQRWHTGGFPGLKPDEVPTILQTGEQVLSRNEVRKKAMAGMAGGGGSRNIRQILAFNERELAQAMAGPAGEEVIVTAVRRNLATLKQELRD